MLIYGLGKRLALCQNLRNASNEDMALIGEISECTYRRYLADESPIPLPLAIRWANYLNLSLDFMFTPKRFPLPARLLKYQKNFPEVYANLMTQEPQSVTPAL